MNPNITDYFDHMAKNRNAVIIENLIVNYEQEERSRGVLSYLNPQAGELILDVGCGNARDLIPVLKKGSKVVGVDISSQMIEEARHELASSALGGYELKVGDATHLDFPDAYFDKVIASEIIEHIPDWQQSLSEIHRVLKTKGELVISAPNRHSWYGFDRYIIFEKILRKQWDHPYDHWKTYTELERALTACGYAITAKRGICYMPGFIIPYFVLPRLMKRMLVSMVKRIEMKFSYLFPIHGYMICIKAMKN